MKRRIILDVDTGIDDMVALMVAMKSDKLKIEGIIASHGNTSIENSLRNTLVVTQYLNKSIKVYKGSERPLVVPKNTAGDIHGESGLGNTTFGIPTKKEEKQRGIDFLIETVLNNPNEITIVMTGPLTDLALAIRVEPKLEKLIKEVVLMGGSITRGNRTSSSEFNIFCDAESAKIVFESQLNITMFPLDVTSHVLLSKEKLDNYRKYNSFLNKQFSLAMDYYSNKIKQYGLYEYPAMHDPCTIAYCIDPSIFTYENHTIDIETQGSLCYGRTVSYNGIDANRNVKVAVDYDSEKFFNLFDSTIKCLSV